MEKYFVVNSWRPEIRYRESNCTSNITVLVCGKFAQVAVLAATICFFAPPAVHSETADKYYFEGQEQSEWAKGAIQAQMPRTALAGTINQIPVKLQSATYVLDDGMLRLELNFSPANGNPRTIEFSTVVDGLDREQTITVPNSGNRGGGWTHSDTYCRNFGYQMDSVDGTGRIALLQRKPDRTLTGYIYLRGDKNGGHKPLGKPMELKGYFYATESKMYSNH